MPFPLLLAQSTAVDSDPNPLLQLLVARGPIVFVAILLSVFIRKLTAPGEAIKKRSLEPMDTVEAPVEEMISLRRQINAANESKRPDDDTEPKV